MNGGRQPGEPGVGFGRPVPIARTCERVAEGGGGGARRVLSIALLLATAGLAVPGHAAEPEAAIQAGRAALRQQAFPWYDDQQDRLRRLDVQPEVEPAVHRDSTWHTTPRKTGDWSWLPELPGWIGQLFRVLIWTALGLGALVLVGLLVRAYLARDPRRVAAGGRGAPDAGADADQIAEWVLPVPAPNRDLLDETRRRVAQGDYTHAILFLFAYQLQTLDRHGLIRLARGKTNRQYRDELAAEPQLRAIFQQVLVGFEDVFFGHHRIEKERFEACWSQLDTFHHHIQQATS